MSPQSNSSSLGAQNGSAYSNSSYSATPSSSRSLPHRQLSGPSAVSYNQRNGNNATASESMNPHQDYTSAEQYTNSDQNYWDPNDTSSESTPTHQDYSSAVQYTSSQTSHQGRSNSEPHYFPLYERETHSYDNELTIEDEPNDTAAAPYTPYYGHHAQQTSARDQDQGYQNSQPRQINDSRSPTTERWNSEQSSEERMRLGLPRYPNGEERRRSAVAADESRRYY